MITVLPEVAPTEFVIAESDIRIDTFRASGAGGQHVNTTDSAVRLTHLPTGVVVSSQSERSQHKNKEAGMKVLRARLHALEMERIQKERQDTRAASLGGATGARSDKIRTYNYPQDRLTDHRIGYKAGLQETLKAGSQLQDLFETLGEAHRKDRLGLRLDELVEEYSGAEVE